MTARELKKIWHAAPFKPFKIVLPGGRKIPVPHPDFLTVSPSGRIAQVWRKDDTSINMDVFLITAIETVRDGKKAARQK